jgi:hypothetical protein
MLGFAVGRCRDPLCELTADQSRALRDAIEPWVAVAAATPAR